MKKIVTTITLAVIIITVMVSSNGCKKLAIETATTDVVNIYDYLKQHPDQYSSITKIVDKSGYSGFLNAYGLYTMFAPANDAVQLYLSGLNKTIDQLTEDEAKNIVKFHLLEDTLPTSKFKDGKLPLVTMYGQYLVTAITNTGGVSSININRQALVIQGNILTGNGLIHGIDHVLVPASKTVAQLIADNPDLSIFKQALMETGYYDTLNTVNLTNPERRWLTVLAETNQALLDSGITSYADLKVRYSNTGNPLDPLDSLHIYAAYHIIPDASYLADIVSASSHTSLQPLEVLVSKLEEETVLINDIDFNGVHEQGVELNRPASDVSATNGVLHIARAHFAPKTRTPFPVYWDVADFPEVRKLPAIFRRASLNFPYGSIKDITWDKPTNSIKYAYTTGASVPVFWNDHLEIPMGNTSRHGWIEFTTPLLVKGKYKVWICYRAAKQSGSLWNPASGSKCPVEVSFDGQVLSRPFAFTTPRPAGSDGELEALGWKKYSPTAGQEMSGKFVGVVDVPTTDRHKTRLRVLPDAGTGQNTNWLDMIHFIPVDMNQYLPRFNRDGTLQYF
jgi:uncharacterized surface protein with fasciclin (FAS1) repeats